MLMVDQINYSGVEIVRCSTENHFHSFVSDLLHQELNKGLCVLPGGQTPREIFQKFSRDYRVKSSHKMLLSDERLIDSSRKESNFKMISETLVGISENPSFVSYWDEINDYGEKLLEKKISEILKENPRSCAFLGIGNDGHTASLFPGYFDVNTERVGFSLRRVDDGFSRFTLSYRTLMSFEKIVFVAKGPDKNNLIRKFLNANSQSESYPFVLFAKNHKNVTIIYEGLEINKK